ncbi:MAG: hypothetical protein R2838_25800 [Caldilineaceae bacterium]
MNAIITTAMAEATLHAAQSAEAYQIILPSLAPSSRIRGAKPREGGGNIRTCRKPIPDLRLLHRRKCARGR